MKIDRASSGGTHFAAAPPVAPIEHATPEGATRDAAAMPAARPGPPARALLPRFGLPLLLAALLTLPALWPRAPFALDVGRPGDQLFLTNAHGDERVAEYTYRWTNKYREPTLLTIPGWAAIGRARVTLRAQALPEVGPVEVRLLVNGQPAATLPVDGTMAERTVEIAIPGGGDATGDLTLAIDAPTTRPPGDGRDLGIKLDTLRIEPLARDGGIFWRTLWPHLGGLLLLVAALLALIGGAAGRLATVGRYGAALAVPLLAALALPWALAALPAALWATAAALALRRWRPLTAALARGWALLDRPRVATWVMVGGLALYVAIMLPFLLVVPWINHADYADNAVVARNLVRGNGFTVDYVAQFYRDWPTLQHPAETWPPLQPLMIAVAFALFDVSVGVAKLPNLLVMLGLLWLVFRVGTWLWSSRVGLLAALLVAVNPDLFDGVVYPLNDTAFTFLAFGCIVLIALGADRNPDPAGAGEGPVGGAPARGLRRLARTPRATWLLLGVLGGLLVLCKPSGAVLLAGGGAWALWEGWRRGALRGVLLGGLLAAVVAAAVWSPWGVRNQLTFGVPFYSTESQDAWLLEFREWETIYKVYAGRAELPHPRLLVGYGYDAVSGKITLQFRKAWGDLKEGAITPLPLLALAIVGGLLARERRQRLLLLAFGAATLVYGLFVLIYWHYEQRYTLFLIPWTALLGAAGLWWLHDRVAEARGRVVAGLAVPLVLVILLAPQWATLQDNRKADLRTPNSVVMAEWVRDNTPPDAVVMTRNPWEFSWHSERLSVMIPYDDLATIKAIAAKYGVTYLQLDGLTSARSQRPDLGPLYAGPDEWQGFRKVYDRRNEGGEGLLIYTFPRAGR